MGKRRLRLRVPLCQFTERGLQSQVHARETLDVIRGVAVAIGKDGSLLDPEREVQVGLRSQPFLRNLR